MSRLFKSSTDTESLGYRFRQRRIQHFLTLAENVCSPVRVLDVGGSSQFWLTLAPEFAERADITILNQHSQPEEAPGFRYLQGDAVDLSSFSDDEFDVVFSNSVIEHLSSAARQKMMADEVQRAGKHHYIQTPNKHFPIEPHYLVPFMQYLPRALRYCLLTCTPISRGRFWDKPFAKMYVNEIVLMTGKDVRRLFPSSCIWHEKVCGMTKSYVAHNFHAGEGTQ